MESTNVMHEILKQLTQTSSCEESAVPTKAKEYPEYFIHGAGTGGTMTSVGRYVNRYNLPIKCVLASTEHSVFYDWAINGHFTNDNGADHWVPPGISGVGFSPMGPLQFGVTTRFVQSIRNNF